MDAEGALWDPVESELLAQIVDALHWLLYQNGDGKSQKPRPTWRPRPPGVDERRMRLYQEHKAERQRELEVMANGG
jgi:hypothetical protein